MTERKNQGVGGVEELVYFGERPDLVPLREGVGGQQLYEFVGSTTYVVRVFPVSLLTDRILPWKHESLQVSLKTIDGLFHELEEYNIRIPKTELKLDPVIDGEQNLYVVTNKIEGQQLWNMLTKVNYETRERIRPKVEDLFKSLARYISDKYKKGLLEEAFYFGDIFDSEQYMVSLGEVPDRDTLYLVDTDPDFFSTHDSDSFDDWINDYLSDLKRLEEIFGVRFTEARQIIDSLMGSLPKGHRIWTHTLETNDL